MAVQALLQSVLLVNVMNANPRGALVSRSLAICTETKQHQSILDTSLYGNSDSSDPLTILTRLTLYDYTE